jgi:hypothetical protein
MWLYDELVLDDRADNSASIGSHLESTYKKMNAELEWPEFSQST